MRFTEWLGEQVRRGRMLFSHRDRFDQEMEEEMLLHRELRTRELQKDGTDTGDARYAVQRKFGNTLRLREEIHHAWGWTAMDNLLRDFKYAGRRLRKSPGFTTVAVLILALGIGANTAIFTLIQQVMFNPLPVAHAGELYSLGDYKHACCWGGLQDDFSVYSYPLYQYLRDHTPEFSDLAGFMAGSVSLGVRREGDRGGAQFFRGEFVSGNYFSVLGVDARAGRMLEPADDQRNAAPVAVMSYRAWQNKFGANPALIGKVLLIRGVPVTLAGITPPEFFGDTLASDPPDFWMPLSMEALLNPGQASLMDHWNEYWMYAVGRLRPDANPREVEAHATAELQQWLTQNYVAGRYSSDPNIAGDYIKEIPKQHINVVRASGGVISARDNNRSALLLLMIISALVLLIACANIANLLLARGTTGRLQIAVRLALGASRSHILRQTMTEGVLLALLGGLVGLPVSIATTRGILSLAFRHANYVPIHTTPSLLVLGFAFAISLVTGVIFSTAPAWIASRTQPADPMRGAGRTTQDYTAFPQKSLLVLQAAVSFVLLVGAGLLTASLRHWESRSFGIQTQGRVVAWIDLSRNQYPPTRLEGFYRQLQQQLAQIPGVVSASFSSSSPMSGGSMTEGVVIEGKPPFPTMEFAKWPRENRVGAHYFETVGTRLLRGRAVDDRDTPNSHHVAVVDQAFVNLFLPNEDPIGKHFGIQTEAHNHDYEIVGLVEDAQYDNPRYLHAPSFFLPLLQAEKYEDTAQDLEQLDSAYVNAIELHVAGRPEDFAEPLRLVLAGLDPNLTVIRVTSMADQVSRNFDQERLVAWLTSVYGLLALLLASVGLYGVASYATARRTNEIGIRMALGADRGSVLSMMMRSAMAPIVLGLAIGVPLTLAATRVLSSQLYGVSTYDPLILLGALAALSLSAVIASVLPARRAASIDPMRALRTE